MAESVFCQQLGWDTLEKGLAEDQRLRELGQGGGSPHVAGRVQVGWCNWYDTTRGVMGTSHFAFGRLVLPQVKCLGASEVVKYSQAVPRNTLRSVFWFFIF